ncbi:unnamed protein product [Lampetra planeri]
MKLNTHLSPRRARPVHSPRAAPSPLRYRRCPAASCFNNNNDYDDDDSGSLPPAKGDSEERDAPPPRTRLPVRCSLRPSQQQQRAASRLPPRASSAPRGGTFCLFLAYGQTKSEREISEG